MFKEYPLFIKVIAAILVVTFFAQDVVWANPDAFRDIAAPSTLQIAPFSTIAPLDPVKLLEARFAQIEFQYHDLVEMREMFEELRNRKITVPITEESGVKLYLDFEQSRNEGDVWTIPCTALDRDGRASAHDVRIDADGGILVLKPGETLVETPAPVEVETTIPTAEEAVPKLRPRQPIRPGAQGNNLPMLANATSGGMAAIQARDTKVFKKPPKPRLARFIKDNVFNLTDIHKGRLLLTFAGIELTLGLAKYFGVFSLLGGIKAGHPVPGIIVSVILLETGAMARLFAIFIYKKIDKELVFSPWLYLVTLVPFFVGFIASAKLLISASFGIRDLVWLSRIDYKIRMSMHHSGLVKALTKKRADLLDGNVFKMCADILTYQRNHFKERKFLAKHGISGLIKRWLWPGRYNRKFFRIRSMRWNIAAKKATDHFMDYRKRFLFIGSGRARTRLREKLEHKYRTLREKRRIYYYDIRKFLNDVEAGKAFAETKTYIKCLFPKAKAGAKTRVVLIAAGLAAAGAYLTAGSSGAGIMEASASLFIGISLLSGIAFSTFGHGGPPAALSAKEIALEKLAEDALKPEWEGDIYSALIREFLNIARKAISAGPVKSRDDEFYNLRKELSRPGEDGKNIFDYRDEMLELIDYAEGLLKDGRMVVIEQRDRLSGEPVPATWADDSHPEYFSTSGAAGKVYLSSMLFDELLRRCRARMGESGKKADSDSIIFLHDELWLELRMVLAYILTATAVLKEKTDGVRKMGPGMVERLVAGTSDKREDAGENRMMAAFDHIYWAHKVGVIYPERFNILKKLLTADLLPDIDAGMLAKALAIFETSPNFRDVFDDWLRGQKLTGEFCDIVMKAQEGIFDGIDPDIRILADRCREKYERTALDRLKSSAGNPREIAYFYNIFPSDEVFKGTFEAVMELNSKDRAEFIRRLSRLDCKNKKKFWMRLEWLTRLGREANSSFDNEGFWGWLEMLAKRRGKAGIPNGRMAEFVKEIRNAMASEAEKAIDEATGPRDAERAGTAHLDSAALMSTLRSVLEPGKNPNMKAVKVLINVDKRLKGGIIRELEDIISGGDAALKEAAIFVRHHIFRSRIEPFFMRPQYGEVDRDLLKDVIAYAKRYADSFVDIGKAAAGAEAFLSYGRHIETIPEERRMELVEDAAREMLFQAGRLLFAAGESEENVMLLGRARDILDAWLSEDGDGMRFNTAERLSHRAARLIFLINEKDRLYFEEFRSSDDTRKLVQVYADLARYYLSFHNDPKIVIRYIELVKKHDPDNADLQRLIDDIGKSIASGGMSAPEDMELKLPDDPDGSFPALVVMGAGAVSIWTMAAAAGVFVANDLLFKALRSEKYEAILKSHPWLERPGNFLKTKVFFRQYHKLFLPKNRTQIALLAATSIILATSGFPQAAVLAVPAVLGGIDIFSGGLFNIINDAKTKADIKNLMDGGAAVPIEELNKKGLSYGPWPVEFCLMDLSRFNNPPPANSVVAMVTENASGESVIMVVLMPAAAKIARRMESPQLMEFTIEVAQAGVYGEAPGEIERRPEEPWRAVAKRKPIAAKTAESPPAAEEATADEEAPQADQSRDEEAEMLKKDFRGLPDHEKAKDVEALYHDYLKNDARGEEAFWALNVLEEDIKLLVPFLEEHYEEYHIVVEILADLNLAEAEAVIRRAAAETVGGGLRGLFHKKEFTHTQQIARASLERLEQARERDKVESGQSGGNIPSHTDITDGGFWIFLAMLGGYMVELLMSGCAAGSTPAGACVMAGAPIGLSALLVLLVMGSAPKDKESARELDGKIAEKSFSVKYAGPENPIARRNAIEMNTYEIYNGVMSAIKDAGIDHDNKVIVFEAFKHLIENAVDAVFLKIDGDGPETADPGSITFRILRDSLAGKYAFVLEDNGIGIGPAIFEDWRVNKFTSTKWSMPAVTSGVLGDGARSVLRIAWSNGFSIRFMSGTEGRKAYEFNRDADGRTAVGEAPRKESGTTVVLSVPDGPPAALAGAAAGSVYDEEAKARRELIMRIRGAANDITNPSIDHGSKFSRAQDLLEIGQIEEDIVVLGEIVRAARRILSAGLSGESEFIYGVAANVLYEAMTKHPGAESLIKDSIAVLKDAVISEKSSERAVTEAVDALTRAAKDPESSQDLQECLVPSFKEIISTPRLKAGIYKNSSRSLANMVLGGSEFAGSKARCAIEELVMSKDLDPAARKQVENAVVYLSGRSPESVTVSMLRPMVEAVLDESNPLSRRDGAFSALTEALLRAPASVAKEIFAFTAGINGISYKELNADTRLFIQRLFQNVIDFGDAGVKEALASSIKSMLEPPVVIDMGFVDELILVLDAIENPTGALPVNGSDGPDPDETIRDTADPDAAGNIPDASLPVPEPARVFPIKELKDIITRAKEASAEDGRKPRIVVVQPNDVSREAVRLAVDEGLIDESYIEVNDPAEAIDLVERGFADLIMKGEIQTNELLVPMLCSSLYPGGRVSLAVAVEFPVRGEKKLVIFSDSGINKDLDEPTMVEVVRNAIYLAKILGMEPRVALLDYAEYAQGLAAEVAKLNWPDLVEGPMAYDMAVIPGAAAMKGYKGETQGDANILILPCIAAANMYYKTHEAEGRSLASATMGLPVILSSRSDTPETKHLSIAISILVNKAEAGPDNKDPKAGSKIAQSASMFLGVIAASILSLWLWGPAAAAMPFVFFGGGLEKIGDVIDEENVLKRFKKNKPREPFWSKTTKAAKLRMVMLLAKFRGKEPGMLSTNDFYERTPGFNNRPLGGLLYWARKVFNCKTDKEALPKLKKHLKIKDTFTLTKGEWTPTPQFTDEDWNKTRQILAKYEGSFHLPDAIDDVARRMLYGKDYDAIDELARDARNNSASYWVLHEMAALITHDNAVRLSGAIGTSADTLITLFPYGERLFNTCIVKFSKNDFRRYLLASIGLSFTGYWFRVIKVDQKRGLEVRNRDVEQRSRPRLAQITEDEADLITSQLMARLDLSSRDADILRETVFYTGDRPSVTQNQLGARYNISQGSVTNVKKRVTSRIRSDPELMTMFSEAGVDIDVRAPERDRKGLAALVLLPVLFAIGALGFAYLPEILTFMNGGAGDALPFVFIGSAGKAFHRPKKIDLDPSMNDGYRIPGERYSKALIQILKVTEGVVKSISVSDCMEILGKIGAAPKHSETLRTQINRATDYGLMKRLGEMRDREYLYVITEKGREVVKNAENSVKRNWHDWLPGPEGVSPEELTKDAGVNILVAEVAATGGLEQWLEKHNEGKPKAGRLTMKTLRNFIFSNRDLEIEKRIQEAMGGVERGAKSGDAKLEDPLSWETMLKQRIEKAMDAVSNFEWQEDTQAEVQGIYGSLYDVITAMRVFVSLYERKAVLDFSEEVIGMLKNTGDYRGPIAVMREDLEDILRDLDYLVDGQTLLEEETIVRVAAAAKKDVADVLGLERVGCFSEAALEAMRKTARDITEKRRGLFEGCLPSSPAPAPVSAKIQPPEAIVPIYLLSDQSFLADVTASVKKGLNERGLIIMLAGRKQFFFTGTREQFMKATAGMADLVILPVVFASIIVGLIAGLAYEPEVSAFFENLLHYFASVGISGALPLVLSAALLYAPPALANLGGDAVIDDLQTVSDFVTTSSVTELTGEGLRKSPVGSEKADLLLVLGNDYIEETVDCVMTALANGLADTVFISGGRKGGTKFSDNLKESGYAPLFEEEEFDSIKEAEALERILLNRGAATRIFTETVSQDTLQNIKNAIYRLMKEDISYDSVLVLSALLRSRLTAEKWFKDNVKIANHSVHRFDIRRMLDAGAERSGMAMWAFSELRKLDIYAARGHISHMAVPAHVSDAARRLAEEFPKEFAGTRDDELGMILPPEGVAAPSEPERQFITTDQGAVMALRLNLPDGTVKEDVYPLRWPDEPDGDKPTAVENARDWFRYFTQIFEMSNYLDSSQVHGVIVSKDGEGNEIRKYVIRSFHDWLGHDLRTPLTDLMARLEMAMERPDGKIPEKKEKYCENFARLKTCFGMHHSVLEKGVERFEDLSLPDGTSEKDAVPYTQMKAFFLKHVFSGIEGALKLEFFDEAVRRMEHAMDRIEACIAEAEFIDLHKSDASTSEINPTGRVEDLKGYKQVRDVTDANRTAQDIVAMILGMTLLKKKVVLGFDSELGNLQPSKALAIMEVIDELKAPGSPLAPWLKDRLEIVVMEPEKLADELEAYADSGAEVFVFARASKQSVFAQLEKKAHAGYINETAGFPSEALYPLPHVVAIVLAEAQGSQVVSVLIADPRMLSAINIKKIAATMSAEEKVCVIVELSDKTEPFSTRKGYADWKQYIRYGGFA